MNLFAVDILNDIDNEIILPDFRTYTRLIEKIKESILDFGGFKPTNRGYKPGKSKPVWWNNECSTAVERRSTARKAYFRNQSQEALIQYLQVDNEVKNFLRNQKRNSYKQFCSTVNLSMRLKRIWSIIKGFQTVNSAKATNIYNNPNLPEIVSIQQEIINPNIPSIDIPFNFTPNEQEPLNGPFSADEFHFALSRCKKDTSPGIDSIGYSIVKQTPRILSKSLIKNF